MYNGKHWEPVPEKWLRGRTLAAIQGMADRGGTATSAILSQISALLTASRSVNGDPLRFTGTPLPVINCSNGSYGSTLTGPLNFANISQHRISGIA